MAAGAAALVKAAHPELSGQELREVLMGTVDVLPALKTANATSGRLNVARAVLAGRGPRLLSKLLPLSDGHVPGTSWTDLFPAGGGGGLHGGAAQ